MSEVKEILRLDPNIKYTVEDFERWERFFPENLRGLKVLEIGAGQSNVVASLRKRGAEAVAIDPAYLFPVEHDSRTEAYLNEEILTRDKEWYRLLQEARKGFKEDKVKTPGSYVPAEAESLPFKPYTFDFVLSNFCICPVLSLNFNQLEKSMSEALRVLKPGGLLTVFPFDNHEDIYEKKFQQADKHLRNLNRMLKALKDEKGRYSVHIHDITHDLKPENPLRIRKMLLVSKIPQL